MQLPTNKDWTLSTNKMPTILNGKSSPLLLRIEGEVKESVCFYDENLSGWFFEGEKRLISEKETVEWIVLETDENVLNEMYDVMWDYYGFMLDKYGNKEHMYVIVQCLDKLGVYGEVGSYPELIHMAYMKHVQK